MFTPRTKPVEVGEKPWRWDVPSVYQCTWYVYYEAQRQLGCVPPVWWDRATQTGSYPNAKDWIANYRDPWQVKGVDYVPKAGDIVVYDGEYGHVQFMETDIMYSEYSNGNPDSFRNGKFGDYKGKLLGFLHYPYEAIQPVARNTSVNQIQTTDDSLRIRTAPSLDGDVVGFVQIGYYNVLSTKKADGYVWYQIARDRWCADITTKYLPKDADDIIRQIEDYFESMKQQVNDLMENNDLLKEKLEEIHRISDVTD